MIEISRIGSSSLIRTQLLLITYEFPYGRAETFLESELPILCQHFSGVSILPSRLVWSPEALDRTQVRPLPPNASVVGAELLRGRVAGALPAAFALRTHAHAGHASAGTWLTRQKWAARICLKAGAMVLALRRLECREGGLPFIYSYWNTEAAEAVALLRLRRRVPGFITRCHGIDTYVERLAVPVRPLERLTRATVETYVPISMHGLNYLADRGVPRSKLRLSRLGVRSALCRSPASTDGIFRVVTCSGIIPLKRVELLAEALVGLDVPFEWTHLGDGPRRAAVDAIIANFPQSGRARLLGSRTNAEVLTYYRKNPVDLFVNVSETEGVPVSIMEALAHGVPCLATRVGGTGEIVDTECGELLPPDLSVLFLRERLREAAVTTSLWCERRDAAHRRWAERCDAEKNFTEFATWLAEKASEEGVHI